MKNTLKLLVYVSWHFPAISLVVRSLALRLRSRNSLLGGTTSPLTCSARLMSMETILIPSGSTSRCWLINVKTTKMIKHHYRTNKGLLWGRTLNGILPSSLLTKKVFLWRGLAPILIPFLKWRRKSGNISRSQSGISQSLWLFVPLSSLVQLPHDFMMTFSQKLYQLETVWCLLYVQDALNIEWKC